MKENYYQTETIDLRAGEFLKQIESVRNKRKWKLNPDYAALLVLDMQRVFLEKNSHAFIPAAQAVIPRIKQLQTLFLERNLPVFQTRHINNEKNAGLMKKWWRDLITTDNTLSTLSAELFDTRVPVINKSQYDSFFDTGLHSLLKNSGVTQVVVTGVMTHLCCETTARSAFMLGFDVFFGIDTTATYNSKFHLSSLINLSHGFAIPLLAAEIAETFRLQ